MSSSQLREIAPGVHVAEARQRFLTLEVGARMTVLELDEGLLVHSPVPGSLEAVSQLGEARWVLAPNLLHHLYVTPWAQAGVDVWAAPGLEAKRQDVAFAGVIDSPTHPFGADVAVLPLSCFGLTNEVVVLHRPSRTLIVCDLAYNIGADAPWRTRATMWALGGYPGCRVTALERFGMRREAARRDLATIASWDFDRLVMAHGEVIETGAKGALLGAFGWLSIPTGRLAE